MKYYVQVRYVLWINVQFPSLSRCVKTEQLGCPLWAVTLLNLDNIYYINVKRNTITIKLGLLSTKSYFGWK
jgi:hypothetical protein